MISIPVMNHANTHAELRMVQNFCVKNHVSNCSTAREQVRDIGLAQTKTHQEIHMTTRIQALTSLFALVALSACGGGDSSPAPAPVSVIPVVPVPVPSPPSTPAPVPAPTVAPLRFTQADMQTNTALGATNQVLAGNYTSVLLSFFSPLLQGLSTEVAGTGSSAPLSCVTNNQGSGSFTTFTTKTGVRMGLAVGDSLRFNFVNCRLGTSGFTFNGIATFTAQSAIVNLSNSSYDMAFRAGFDNFSVSFNNSPLSYAGLINATSKLAGLTTSYGFEVPAGSEFSVNGAGLTTRYGPAASFAMSDTTTPSAFSRRLTGTVTLQTANATPVTLALQVTNPIAGNRNVSGLVPTSGAFTTRNSGLNLLTSAVVSGSVVNVSGDSDRDGILDLAFSTTWAALNN